MSCMRTHYLNICQPAVRCCFRSMPHRLPTTCARRQNSSATQPANTVAELDRWISSKRQITMTDTLRAEHLADLHATLPTRRSNKASIRWPEPLKGGTPLAYGHHLVFFHPRNPESRLRWDGTDPESCPPEPWTRRMWAGGRMIWNTPLMVGERVVASSTINLVDKRGLDKGPPMVFVNQKILYRRKHHQDVALEEERSHVYLAAPSRRGVKAVDGIPQDCDYRFAYLPSATTLFRFSALTFNGHFIHLDREYAASEGYPERLVHGPLTALMLLEVFVLHYPETKLTSFEYRAVNPLVVDRYVAICGKKDSMANAMIVWAEDVETKTVGMVGRIAL